MGNVGRILAQTNRLQMLVSTPTQISSLPCLLTSNMDLEEGSVLLIKDIPSIVKLIYIL